jgi:hypothetical protein
VLKGVVGALEDSYFHTRDVEDLLVKMEVLPNLFVYNSVSSKIVVKVAGIQYPFFHKQGAQDLQVKEEFL